MIRIKFEHATADAFIHWNDEGFPHGIRALQKRYFNTGTDNTWKQFKRALEIYNEARADGKTEHNALSDAKNLYPSIVLKKLRSYKPTKHLKGARTGIHPKDMQQKRGRKRKASAGTYVGLQNAMKRQKKQQMQTLLKF